MSKVAVFAVLLRFYLAVPAAADPMIHWLLAAIAVISILVGNLLALVQTNVKRMLGYSSISHFGYLLAVIVASRIGQMPVEAAGVYLLMYLFTSLGAFGVVSMMSSPYRGKDADSLHSYRGLFWKRPYLTAVLTVMMLSLAGIPMTLGFIGKFYLIGVTVEAQLWWLSGAIVLGSALGLYYYLKVMVTLYLREPGMQQRDASADWALSSGGVVVLLSAALVVLLGLIPSRSSVWYKGSNTWYCSNLRRHSPHHYPQNRQPWLPVFIDPFPLNHLQGLNRFSPHQRTGRRSHWLTWHLACLTHLVEP